MNYATKMVRDAVGVNWLKFPSHLAELHSTPTLLENWAALLANKNKMNTISITVPCCAPPKYASCKYW